MDTIPLRRWTPSLEIQTTAVLARHRYGYLSLSGYYAGLVHFDEQARSSIVSASIPLLSVKVKVLVAVVAVAEHVLRRHRRWWVLHRSLQGITFNGHLL